MSRKEERRTKRNDPPGFVPWSNPNEVLPTYTHRNPTQGPSTSGRQSVVSSARRHQDTSAGAEALGRPGRHPPVFVEETRPGAILVPGIDDDGLTIEEVYDEQATIASNEAPTVEVVARAVDTEEESRIRHERDQFQHERDHLRYDLDQLRHMLGNAVVVTPIVTTSRDEENADENIHVDNHDGSPRSDDRKCGTSNRGKRWFAIGAILVIAVAVAVTLAVVLPPKPNPNPNPPGPTTAVPTNPPTTPPPYPLDELLSSIDSNSLTGTIPTEIGMLSDNLTIIDLGWNGLTGTIPSQIGQLTKLTRLNLVGNALTGRIPSEVGQLTKLTFLYLWGNTLTGIPSEIEQLTELTLLELGSNNLSGPIPSQIVELTTLTYLSLYGNTLTGTIPSEILQLTKLTHLSLRDNKLSGRIPSQIGQLTKLTYLSLSENTLTGSIPSEMNSLVNLDRLSLYGNNFMGTYTCPDFIDDCEISCDDYFNDTCRSL